MSVRFAMLGD